VIFNDLTFSPYLRITMQKMNTIDRMAILFINIFSYPLQKFEGKLVKSKSFSALMIFVLKSILIMKEEQQFKCQMS